MKIFGFTNVEKNGMQNDGEIFWFREGYNESFGSISCVKVSLYRKRCVTRIFATIYTCVCFLNVLTERRNVYWKLAFN